MYLFFISCGSRFLQDRVANGRRSYPFQKTRRTDSKRSSKAGESNKNVKSKPDINIIPPKTNSPRTKAAQKAQAVKKTSTPNLQTVDRWYPTHNSSRLISSSNNTSSNPIILEDEDPPYRNQESNEGAPSEKSSSDDESNDAKTTMSPMMWI